MEKISGQKDPVIQLLREIGSEEGRRRNNRFFSEGEELVKRAFDYGSEVDCAILTDKFAASDAGQAIAHRAASVGKPCYYTTEGLLTKILEAKPTPECLAIVERRVEQLSNLFSHERPLIQMVERGENADNLGMLLRSTDAAGMTGAILTATTDPFARRVVRGSRGAVFTTPICIQQDTARVISEAKAAGIQVIATSANTDLPYTSVDFTKPTMIIVGNEHVGITQTARDMSDVVVRIPMLGKINSLNIAVAASVVMYEAVRQRTLTTSDFAELTD